MCLALLGRDQEGIELTGITSECYIEALGAWMSRSTNGDWHWLCIAVNNIVLLAAMNLYIYLFYLLDLYSTFLLNRHPGQPTIKDLYYNKTDAYWWQAFAYFQYSNQNYYDWNRRGSSPCMLLNSIGQI